MGRKISLFGFILICLILSIPTVSAENRVFLDNFNFNLPDYNATNYILDDSGPNYAIYHQAPFTKGFMDIQRIYFNINGLNLTMKMKMGGTPIVNSTIQYEFNANFDLNSTLSLSFYVDKTVGSTNNSQAVIRVRNVVNNTPIYPLYQTIFIPTRTSGRYVYWNINLSQLNNVLPVKDIFIKSTFLNQINMKYQINPDFNGFIKNAYTPTQYSSYVIDEFFIHDNYSPTVNKYLLPSIIVILVIIIVTVFLYVKIK